MARNPVANARHQRDFRRRCRENGPPPSTPHGTRSGYDSYQCRCCFCFMAKSLANRDYRRRRAREASLSG
jgi:hypothetical protein